MIEFASALIGALVVASIPAIAWLSKRATREGRLMLRIQQLGSTFALMPESQEKEIFRGFLDSAVSELNAWLEPDNFKRRRLIRGSSIAIYVIGLISVFVLVPVTNAVDDPKFSVLIGSVIGILIVVATSLTSYFLERRSRRDAAERSVAAAAAATAERIALLAR